MDPNEALVDAINRDDLPALKAALKAGASPDGPAKSRWLPLTIAVLFDRVAVARELLRAGADLARFQKNWRREGGNLAEREMPTLKLLEAAGIDLRTARLQRAVEDGDLAAARTAIAQGADVHARTWGDSTPLEMAFGGGHLALAKALLAAGAELRPKRETRAMLLSDAISNGDLAVVKAVIAAGIDPHLRDESGENALMWSAEAGKLDLFDYFLALGLDPKTEAKASGKSLLDHAREGGNATIIARVGQAGVGSLREQSLALAKALKREFGGRVRVEVTGGEFPGAYVVVPRLAGLGRTQIKVAPQAWQITCEEFKPTLPGFAQKAPVWFIVNRTKPVGFLLQSKPVITSGVFVKYDFLVSRGEQTPAGLVREFCRANEQAILDLQLSDGEFIFFGRGAMVLRCQSTDMAQARARIEILRQLQTRHSRAPEPERTLVAREFRFKPVARGVSPREGHRLGGACAEPPACYGCGGAAQLMAEVDLSDGALPKTKLRRKTWPVFWCLECTDWGPTFHDVSAERLAALDAMGRPVGAPREASTADLPERHVSLVASHAGKHNHRATKCGGTAAWIQSPAVPACLRCKTPMTFVLQLASDRTISYADVGMLYSFVCPACRVSATVVQSH